MLRYVIVNAANQFVEDSNDLARAYMRRNELEVETQKLHFVKLASDWKGAK